MYAAGAPSPTAAARASRPGAAAAGSAVAGALERVARTAAVGVGAWPPGLVVVVSLEAPLLPVGWVAQTAAASVAWSPGWGAVFASERSTAPPVATWDHRAARARTSGRTAQPSPQMFTGALVSPDGELRPGRGSRCTTLEKALRKYPRAARHFSSFTLALALLHTITHTRTHARTRHPLTPPMRNQYVATSSTSSSNVPSEKSGFRPPSYSNLDSAICTPTTLARSRLTSGTVFAKMVGTSVL